MLDRRWTNNEISTLKQMYIADTAFEEIRDAFPARTINAIRQKASRLGLRRPVIKSSLFDSQSSIKCSVNGNDEVYRGLPIQMYRLWKLDSGKHQ